MVDHTDAATDSILKCTNFAKLCKIETISPNLTCRSSALRTHGRDISKESVKTALANKTATR